MPDIFISYAREDLEWVSRFTERLREAGGWDIWWDRRLLPGDQFDSAIESAVDQARCVIVVWSRHSIGSRWVKAEAREGAQRDILVPLKIEGVTPPLEFRSFETADLSRWHGDAAHADFVEIVQVVRRAIGRTRTVTDEDKARTYTGRERAGTVANASRRAVYLWGGGLAVVAAVVAIGVAISGGRAIDPPAHSPSTTTTPVVQPAASARSLPQLSYGTWTLRNAFDDRGGDWSNSAIKFVSQEPTPDGLTLKGTITWRRGEVIGTEEFTGHYIEATRQIFLDGRSVSDPSRLARGSYSAVLSADARSLLHGTWGSTSAGAGGVPGRWEASR